MALGSVRRVQSLSYTVATEVLELDVARYLFWPERDAVDAWGSAFLACWWSVAITARTATLGVLRF